MTTEAGRSGRGNLYLYDATKASWMNRLVETVPSPGIDGLVR